MTLTTDKKNILAYRLLTLGNLRLTTREDLKGNKDGSVEVSSLKDGNFKGAIVTCNEVLETVEVLGINSIDWTYNSIVLSVWVSVENEPSSPIELTYLVKKEDKEDTTSGYSINVIEEDD